MLMARTLSGGGRRLSPGAVDASGGHLHRPRRVLHVFGQMARGGAELRTVEVMRHVDRARYRLEFLALSGRPGALDDEIEALGGRVHLCQLGPLFPWTFIRLLREQRFDVIHSHVHYFSGYLLRLAAQAGVPCRIAHFRSTTDDHATNLRRRMQRAVMRHWIDRYATHVLAVGEGVMASAWGSDWSSDPRCSVLFNGLDVAEFRKPPERAWLRQTFGIAEEESVWIHIGRIDTAKNHLRLVRMFGAWRLRGGKGRLLLVGKGHGELIRRLRAEIAANGLERFVVLAGERDDVARLLRGADIMVYPSVREGLPGAVLEACAAGVAVLGSDIVGIREIARHFDSVRCLSLDVADAGWAEAVDTMLSSQEARPPDKWQTALAHFEASPFTIARCADQLSRVWANRPAATL